MKRRVYHAFSICVLFGLVAVGVVSMAAPPTPSSEPGTVIIGTYGPGTSCYIAGVALADLVKKHTNLKVAVMPQTGDPAIIALLRQRAVQLGINTAPTSIMCNQGSRWYKGKGYPLLLLHPTYSIENVLVAAGDTDIRTAADVRGKRVSAYYYGAPDNEMTLLTHLALRGLTYKDIVPVPVTSFKEGVEAVIEHKADVVSTGLAANAQLQELRAARGVRPIPGDFFSQEAVKRIKEMAPGYIPFKLPKDDVTLKWLKDDPNIPGEIVSLRFWFYLVTFPELSNEVSYAISKAVWENYKELAPVFPRFLRDWKPEEMVSKNAFIPYHTGAIKWFKEKGVWTAEMEELQQRLLAESVR
jgi:TRAP transporter TAXI family solute receptor